MEERDGLIAEERFKSLAAKEGNSRIIIGPQLSG
jgi:hypothetical protein